MFGFERLKTTLELDKILTHIASSCVSESGIQRLLNVIPHEDQFILQEVLAQIQDMREVYQFEGGFPLWAFTDIRRLLSKIEPAQSYLDVNDLIEIKNFLEIISEILQFQKKLVEKYSMLQRVIKDISLNEQLLNQLKFTIEPSGRIFDNASKELKAIRKEIEAVNQEIHQRLERILRKKAEFIQDDYITLRDGRLVVPVREYSVNKIAGIVHGQSNTGATYFVEPLAVVELNNQMQKLLAAEHNEIIKILKRLSDQVRADKVQLYGNFNILIELDTIQARAHYANDNHCIKPGINPEFVIDYKQARHPLLLKMNPDKTVPLNLTIGGDYQQIIISGPNAGGKTVALKTIGLLQLMFQCGFHIPVQEGTRLPICRQIFAVIGDDQSIENDLSTFSSHIHALNEMLTHLDERSLILIDEIGRGTDPDGGAALAVAVLEKLNQEEILSIVTTHQNQLKAYASEKSGVKNAAMQFDMKRLSPLFILEIGIPGSSYTFEICQRYGLDADLLNRAVDLSGNESFTLDQLLADVVEKSRKYQEMSSRVSIKDSELNSLIKLYGEKTQKLKKQEKKHEKEAAEKAKELLDHVNREIETVIREIKESQAEKKVVLQGRNRLQKRRNELQSLLSKEDQPQQPVVMQLKKGLSVHSRQYGFKGVISKIIANRNEVEIDKDGIKILVPMTDVVILDHNSVEKETISETPMMVSTNIANELDLRGLMVDEALRKVEPYLDAAIASAWDEVRLVHGKGTGALRLAIHQYLANLRTIKGYRLGKWGEGDSGVTVVQIK